MLLQEKQIVMDTIRENVEVFKRRNAERWSIRCPYCGDSQKDPTDSHCYIKWSKDESEPLLFKCFLCNKKGVVDTQFLKLLHVKEDLSIILDKQKHNRVQSIKDKPINIITGDPIPNSLQIKYIEHRLGKGFSLEDYDKFKIVWNIESLLPFISSEAVKNSLPSNDKSISFLSDDKTMLLTRMYEDGDIRWKKLRFIKSDIQSYYIIKSTIDLFTKEDIVVNIAEGVMDILSAYKNFNDGPNSVYIASLGSDYIYALDYMILKGFVGKNVVVKIYIDEGINEKELINGLKKYKWMFKNIYVYRNIMQKDIGYPIDQIRLEERKV